MSAAPKPVFARFEQVVIASDCSRFQNYVGHEGAVIWRDLLSRGQGTEQTHQWIYVVQLATESVCFTCLESDLRSAGEFDSEDAHLGKSHEISFDLVPAEDMEFIEGVYRIPGKFWEVFVISKRGVEDIEYELSEWRSGVKGVVIRIPQDVTLDQNLVLELMREWFGNSDWTIVRGPDSIVLR